MPPHTHTPTRSRTPSRGAATPAAADAKPRKEAKHLGAYAVTDDNRVDWTPEKDAWDGTYEFGGAPGALALMVFSHAIVYYMWICIDFFGGSAIYPGAPVLEGKPFVDTVSGIIRQHAMPSVTAVGFYLATLVFNWLLAVVMPGVSCVGLPVASEGNRVRRYYCNGLSSFYVFAAVVATAHFSGAFPLQTLRDRWGEFLTSAIVVADSLAVGLYVTSFARGANGGAVRNSGNPVYDYFMGRTLNPRLPFGVDLKMFAEIRASWLTFNTLVWACAADQYRRTGAVSGNMWLLVFINTAYTNACQKGEELIPTTWDIHHEKFGWMLIFWNFVGVPFMYCSQAMYVSRHGDAFSSPTLVAFTLLFVGAYFVFDSANSQKNKFRMLRVGADDSVLRRTWAFPQMPWRMIANPNTIKGPPGSGLELFADGWFRVGARKIHYTADLVIWGVWAAACGTRHFFVPYFQFLFFAAMLAHRVSRDEAKCARKYGKMWDEYCRVCRYRFIPGVY